MTTKTKKKTKAKPKLIPCPNGCGTERPEGEPVYHCVECNKEGFDCCVAGNGVICEECEENILVDDDPDGEEAE
jgi:DNA-directed RNA polymerase subunit RPC12/RpoP